MTDAPKRQADKLRDMTHELDCAEDEAAFEEKLRKVAKSAPAKAGKD